MTRSALERALDQARATTVDPETVRVRVTQIRARAHVRPARRWPWAVLVAGVGAAAASALVVLRLKPEVPRSVAQLGSRVAIVATPGTQYRVVTSTAAATRVDVERGSLTARLFEGAGEHSLQLSGGGVIASATGTIYTFTVQGETTVTVHQGEVLVAAEGGASRPVSAGHTWTRDATGPATTDGDAETDLLVRFQLSPPERVSVEEVPPIPEPEAAPSAPAPVSAETVWKRARLLRHQGNTSAALRVLRELKSRGDATFSPLAAIEETRIHHDVLLDPQAVVRLSERFLEQHADHRLAPEVRAMKCQAENTLGVETTCPRSVDEPR